ncbi:Zinc-finger homeodomain protein 1 [Nymphaea thermarum]|nr:Zinc-finger homeodomain protein 1 [Nymphaea thermarum]
MDFDDQEEEGEVTLPAPVSVSGSYDLSRLKMVPPTCGESQLRKPRYKECMKNHAVGIGGHAIDGCGEFLAAGDEGTLDALKCAACNCHRNFHRREGDGELYAQFPPPYYRAAAPPALGGGAGSGYLHMGARGSPHPLAHHHPQPLHNHHGHGQALALPSSRDDHDQEEMVNHHPVGSGSGGAGGCALMKKRFRTKFTQEQKDRMLEFAEKLGWRIQKHDEAAVQQFCMETCVKRHVLKVWMHNNKHTLEEDS